MQKVTQLEMQLILKVIRNYKLKVSRETTSGFRWLVEQRDELLCRSSHFDPELMLLSIWSFACSPCVHISIRFSSFLQPPKTLL